MACVVRSHRLADDPAYEDSHVSACLQCQVEALRYRTLVRRLGALRHEVLEAPPGLLLRVQSGLGDGTDLPKKTPGIEAAVAAAGMVAVAGAVALWRRSLSA